MRLFLDANVIFAVCWKPEGSVSRLFDLAKLELCSLFTSEYALAEVRKNLENKKPEALQHLDHLISRLEVLVNPELTWVEQAEVTGLPLKDTPILAAALQHKLDVLVTGDLRHFSKVLGKTVSGVQILTPAMVIARLIEQV
jgi:predicted nucleic acid-binding protein